jgi:hypothetical protein
VIRVLGALGVRPGTRIGDFADDLAAAVAEL